MSTDPTIQRLQELKQKVETAKSEQVRAEARMEELQKQRDQLLKEMETQGVTPESIDQEIQRLEGERDGLIAEAEQLLTGDQNG